MMTMMMMQKVSGAKLWAYIPVNMSAFYKSFTVDLYTSFLYFFGIAGLVCINFLT